MARPAGCLKTFFAVPLALIVLGLGMWLLGNVNRVLTHDTTEGVVIRLDESRDSDGDTLFTPTYEYEVGGQTYTYESQVSYGGMLVPELGEVRTMLYDPSDPADVQVRSMFVLVGLPLILMAIPLLVLVAMVWSSVRRRRRATEVPTQLGPTTTPPWVVQSSPPGWEQSPESTRVAVEALFMGTEPSQMDADGHVRYRVKARAEINGDLHRFRSDWLDEDPTLYYMKHGNKVDVLVDPDDSTSYEVALPPVE